MAEETDDDLDLDLELEDAGSVFRAEMAATNFFMGYWQYILAIAVAFLVGVLVWGEYGGMVRGEQRHASAELAKVEATLPGEVMQLPAMHEQGTPGADEASLVAAAVKMTELAIQTDRAASVEASLKAAEIYRIADKPVERRVALEAARAHASGVLLYSAEAALAALDLEEGNGDGAVKRYRALMGGGDTYLAQQATVDLGLALEHLDRKEEALTVYDDFLVKWPESTRTEHVASRKAGLGGA
ncbi:MAG: hypothetical protein GWP91_26070 [Rhodobacterales bacterium]|nr:hypothetical protein [Rhodobacterales bacterium]